MRGRSARQIAALIVAVLAVCSCCLVAVGLMGSGGGGGEGDFVTLIERRGRMRHGTRATTGQGGARMGDGDAVASKEIKEALREVRATIASLEGKSRSIGRGSPGQQRAMLGGGAADTSTEHASSSNKNELTGEDLKCYIEGDAFLRLVNSCCKTLYFGPGTDVLLPMDLADSPQAKPFTSGLPYGVRYRYAIGNGKRHGIQRRLPCRDRVDESIFRVQHQDGRGMSHETQSEIPHMLARPSPLFSHAANSQVKAPNFIVQIAYTVRTKILTLLLRRLTRR